MTDIVASLDGGGTKTELIWADAVGRVGRALIAEGCNPQDRPDWAAPIRAALAALPSMPRQITFGIPGYGEIPGLDARIIETLQALCPSCTIVNDVALAYQGAYPGGGGVLVLAGTGSMAMAQGPLGLHRTGGWGDAFGDEGSAYSIGRAALALASQMIDGREPDTGFATELSLRLGCTSADGPFTLMTWTMAQPHQRAAIAGIAAHVDALAEAGNSTAAGLLIAAAGDLWRLARTAHAHAGLPEPVCWTAAGSVFKSKTLTRAVSDWAGSEPVPAAHGALMGGLITAARTAGWPATEAWRNRLKETP